jgi:AcrR family transcriptional regulator
VSASPSARRFHAPAHAPHRPPSIRETQKAETRARVVEAARTLFASRGYAEATIRDIARQAGVAPGSVFTTFASKAELLQEIVFSRYAELFAQIGQAVDIKAPTIERLAAFSRAAYRNEMEELRLLSENIGASWTWSVEADRANRERLRPFFSTIARVLEEGVKAGELSADTPIETIADMMFSCYLRNFRRALFDGWTADQCGDYLGEQMRIILEGCRKR